MTEEMGDWRDGSVYRQRVTAHNAYSGVVWHQRVMLFQRGAGNYYVPRVKAVGSSRPSVSMRIACLLC